MKLIIATGLLVMALNPLLLSAQDHTGHSMPTPSTTAKPGSALPVIADMEPQPLLVQAIRLQEALAFLGSSLSETDTKRLKDLQQKTPDGETIAQIQAILDPYCLAMVTINPEARVKVIRGPAPARLMQGGWKSFLVKVQNEANVTAELQVESPNAQFPFQRYEWYPKDQGSIWVSSGQKQREQSSQG